MKYSNNFFYIIQIKQMKKVVIYFNQFTIFIKFLIIFIFFVNVNSAKSLELCDELLNNKIIISTLAEDGILTMSPSGSYPIVTYKDKTYFGYFTSKNEIKIRHYDNNENKISDEIILWNNWGYNSAGDKLGDDHANPSIIVLQYQNSDNQIHNGKILVAVAEHRWRLQVRRSKHPQSIFEWDNPVSIRDTLATYARLVEIFDGTIYLFCRLSRFAPNSRASFCYWKSKDAGNTWSDPQLLIDAAEGTDDAIYITLSPNATHTELHIGANRIDYDNPKKGVWRYRDIYYLKFDAVNGTWLKANNKSIGQPPFSLGDIELVYKTASSPGKEDWTYISDIKDSKNGPRIVSITEFGRGNIAKHPSIKQKYINYHYILNGEWITDKVSATMSFHYVNMASIFNSEKPMILGFISGKDGDSTPAVFEKRSDGWRVLKRLSVPADGSQHARPFITNLDEKGLFAIWCKISDYHGSPYTNWKSSIVGAILQ